MTGRTEREETTGSRPRRFSRAAGAVAALGFGTLLALLLAEVVCRILPVSTGIMALPVNAASPVFRFTPDQDYLWSRGPRFSTVNRGRVNNDGFVNDQPYDAGDARPLLAVVGDSYVEALMVPYGETLHGRIQRCVDARGRVYTFAASGAPLSQYLVWAEYARSGYAPDVMAFVVVGNDFDESLAKYKAGPGFHHFVDTGDGKLALARFDYAPTTFRRVLRRFALARYLVLNVHLHRTLAALWAALVAPVEADERPAYVGNTEAGAGGERLRDSIRAVQAFLEALPTRAGLEPSSIAFLVDGVRPQLYGGDDALRAVEDAYFPRMREAFMHEARARGYVVVDLQRSFRARHEADGSTFEFEDDHHWNGTGHEVAAAALLRTVPVRALFSGALDGDGCPTGWPR